MPKFRDVTGQRFTRLVAIRPIRRRIHGGIPAIYWVCQCDCGGTAEARLGQLTGKAVQSCGCLRGFGEKARKKTGPRKSSLEPHKEEVVRMYTQDRLSLTDIGKNFGLSAKAVSAFLRSNGVKIRSHGGFRRNLVGQTFGYREVLSQSDIYITTKCCCGKIQTLRREALRQRDSCGCIANAARAKKPRVVSEAYEEISHTYWQRTKHGASTRGLEFNITQKEVWGLYIQQGRKCALSGQPITFCSSTRIDPENQTASLDRIDVKLGYVPGNVQWVHKSINFMKQASGQEEFIAMCNAVARTHPRPEADQPKADQTEPTP